MLLVLLAGGVPTAASAQAPEYPLPPSGGGGGEAEVSYLNPFPIVRLVGSLTRQGARIKLLSVKSPTGSKVRVRCVGGRRKRCPFRSKTRTSPRSKVVRFRAIRRRRLKAGATLQIRVWRGNTIGKFTSFRIRKGRAPRRRDACLMPGATKPSECP